VEAAGFVSMASLLYGLYEFALLHRLRPSAFKWGRLALKESSSLPVDTSGIEPGRVYKTRIGQFRFLKPPECLFCPKFEIFTLRVHTPFPVKGRIRWRNGVATIEGRIPLGSTVFVGAWLVGLTAASLRVGPTGSEVALASLGFLALGWLSAGALYFGSLRIELHRARKIIDEIRAQVMSK